MIVSHAHRFIFVPIPKTGTHAVRQALREHLGPDDIEQVGLFEQKKFPWPELASLGHGHFSLRQVAPFLGPGAMRDYLKFAFVRNPFDRFVSYCSFMTRQAGEFERDPRATMHRILFELRPLNHVHFQPQYTLLVDERGALATDFIGRVETMQQSYDELCARIGIPGRALERVNDSRRGDYRQYYDHALFEGVSRLYAGDLQRFGYGF
jgi:hypothetical protein